VVVDAEFPSGDLPGIHSALRVEHDGDSSLVVEVQEHVSPFTVRGVAMSSTSGLQRGLRVVDMGGPIRVPVKTATLGRMFAAPSQ
jgi:F-type H+-transporting ATPase subunit beta